MIVLGIDPGLANTGYGVVSQEGNQLHVIEYGAIRTKSTTPQYQRLHEIHTAIQNIIQQYPPAAMVMEELFFSKNSATALLVGQALGVIQLAAAQAGVDVVMYTPLQVKLAVVGHGKASKAQIQQMVRTLLGMHSIPQPDHAADALAVAICHLHSRRMHRFSERLAE